MRPGFRVLTWLPLVWLLLWMGCGDSSHGDTDGSTSMPDSGDEAGPGGNGGQGGDTGGAGGMAGAGGTAGTGGEAGSAGMQGDAGSAGDGGMQGGAGGSGSSMAEAEEELDRISEGLPAPSMNCLETDGFIIGCVSVSGEYNGEPFDFSCVDTAGLVFRAHSGGGVVCRGEAAGKEFRVRVSLGPLQPNSPGVFGSDGPTAETYADVEHFEREFESHVNWVYQLDDTHDRRFAVVGSAEMLEEPPDLRMEGRFAASFVPNSNCTPDEMGFGCDEVHLRGNFRAFPIVR